MYIRAHRSRDATLSMYLRIVCLLDSVILNAHARSESLIEPWTCQLSELLPLRSAWTSRDIADSMTSLGRASSFPEQPPASAGHTLLFQPDLADPAPLTCAFSPFPFGLFPS